MQRTPHNKIVRDNIPAIITAQGKRPIMKAVSKEEIVAGLQRKPPAGSDISALSRRSKGSPPRMTICRRKEIFYGKYA